MKYFANRSLTFLGNSYQKFNEFGSNNSFLRNLSKYKFNLIKVILSVLFLYVLTGMDLGIIEDILYDWSVEDLYCDWSEQFLIFLNDMKFEPVIRLFTDSKRTIQGIMIFSYYLISSFGKVN